MVKKTKGLSVVAPSTNEKFKFKNDGTSKLGDSEGDVHEIKGELDAEGVVEVEGEVVLQDRLSGVLFSPPHIDASVETEMIQHFVDHAAAEYEGFMIYVTNAAPTPPFNISNKFYFCEAGIWHSSPFDSEIVNYAPNLNPTYEISVPVQGTDSVPFSLDLPADLFQDQDGDALVYTATLQGGGPLPAWLSFDATNTILSGTPSESDVGLLSVLITATDPSNASAATTQEIQILAKPVPFWQGGTNSFGTSGPEDWATVLPNNLLSLNPIQGGSNAWHKITAPDEFSIDNKTVSIDFSFADWYNSSGAGGSNNNIQVGFQCNMPAADDDFMEFSIGDNGSGKSLVPRLNTQNGLVNNYSGGWWTYDPYDPPEDISNMEDFDFRIEIGRVAKHHSWNAYYVPILALAKRRTSHQDLIDAGLENISFEDIRTSSEFQQLYYDLGNSYPKVNKHFFRAQYSMLISMGPYDLPDLTFSPYVKSVQRFPYNNTDPVAIFDKFDITVDESPVQDVNVPFGDFTVEAGQPITITVPSDLFTDPDGLPLVSYATRKTVNWGVIPHWLSFDTSTGVYTGTPSADDVGSYEIAVWGNDDASESAGEISTPIMLSSRSFTLTVEPGEPTEANPWLPVFDDLDGGKFISPAPGTLQGDGLGQGSALAGATETIVDLLDYISPGDISKALVLEWTFSEDPADITNGNGHYGSFFHAVLRNADNNSQYFQMTKFKSQYDDMFYGQQSGNNNSTGYNYVENFVPSEWEYRLIVRPAEWWESGNLKKIAYAIATRKKDSSYTWDDVMNISEFGTFLPNQNSAYTEALIDWRMNYSVGDLDSFRLYPQLGSHDNSSHDGHWEDIKMFITELDPPVAPVFNSNYDLSLLALIDQGAWSYQLPTDTFTDTNSYETLTYSAEMADGSPFPAWLSFDTATRTFSGTPQSSDLGTLSIRVTVTDSDSLTADTIVTLDVAYPTMFADPDVGGYDIVQFLSAHNGDAIGSSLVQDQDGPVTMIAADGTSPQWVTPNVTPPPGKKLVVKWEYDTLDDGNIIVPSGGNMSVSTYDGGGWSWKYFQIHSGPNAYYRFAGSGYAYPTSAQGVDLYNSQFRMETTFDETNGSRNTIMKIRPVGSAVDFDTMTAADHGNNGCYYMESSHTAEAASGDSDTDGDGWRDTKINISAYPAASDASGDFIKFKYLRYEIVDE